MEIRRIRQQEAERVTALWDDAAREVVDGGPLPPRGRRNIAAMLALAATHQRVACFVADTGGELQGFVVAELAGGLLPGAVGTVEELYVAPPARRRGTGRALALHAAAWLHEQGAGVVRAEVAEDEPDALAFAERLGWQREAIRFATYRD